MKNDFWLFIWYFITVKKSDNLSGSAGQQVKYFVLRREFTGGFLRIDQIMVDNDLESPAAGRNQFHIRGKLLLDPVRQTGGPGAIVSLVAVFNADLHRSFLPKTPAKPGLSPHGGCPRLLRAVKTKWNEPHNPLQAILLFENALMTTAQHLCALKP